MTDLITPLKTLVAEAMDLAPADLPADGRYQDLADWNSLAALSLVTALEDEYGIVLNDGALKSAPTLEALATLVEARRAAGVAG